MTILLSKRVEYLQENTYIEWRSYELKREIRRPRSAGMSILNEPWLRNGRCISKNGVNKGGRGRIYIMQMCVFTVFMISPVVDLLKCLSFKLFAKNLFNRPK